MRKKYYLTLDTETATLPFANEIAKTAKQKQKIAIAKPLVYDIGWVITDTKGNIVKEVNYLIQETFFVPNVFNTAYYKDKRPIYMEMYKKGLLGRKTWNEAVEELIFDLQTCDIACAYNACFDYKKAIPFTERYIQHLYSEDYTMWEASQKAICQRLVRSNRSGAENKDYLQPFFELRGEKYPIVDLWGVACDRLINIDKYRNFCLDNKLLTASGEFFKTSAETSFQYLLKQHDFIEDHTALSDAKIEAQILAKALKKGKIEPELRAFPFRELGTTYEYVLLKRKKSIPVVAEAIKTYLENVEKTTAYSTKLENIFYRLG